MSGRRGFWSYVHQDDEVDRGRIVQLAHDVVDEYNMLTGETITLFLDKDALAWGQTWREEIQRELNTVEFFIPVLTPRYVRKPQCRLELKQFLQSTKRELLLPLHYVDVPELGNEDPTNDELIEQLRDTQWFDWRSLRFDDRNSESYRRAVNKMALELIRANRILEERAAERTIEGTVEPEEPPEDEAPGIIDRLAQSMESAEGFSGTLTAISEEIRHISEGMTEATKDVQNPTSNRKGEFARRVLVARRLSERLATPIDKICELVPTYETQLQDIDDGIRLVLEMAPQARENEPEAEEILRRFLHSVQGMSESAQNARTSTQGMIDSVVQLEPLSRDLRPGFRRLRQALTIIVNGMERADEWMKLIRVAGPLTLEEKE